MQMTDVIAATGHEFHVKPQEIRRPSSAPGHRRRECVRARQVAAWIGVEHLGLGLSEVGRALGDRHHSTIRSACLSVARSRERQPQMVLSIDRILALARRGSIGAGTLDDRPPPAMVARPGGVA